MSAEEAWEAYVAEAYPTFGDPGREIRAAFEAGRASATEWEYGSRWHVEGDPDSPVAAFREDRVVEYAEASREEALQIIEDDRKAMGLERSRGVLIRRPVFDSPWEEVK